LTDDAIDSDGEAGVNHLRAELARNRDIFGVAKKRSVTIAGHATSIRIESPYWDVLVTESRRFGIPLNALVAEIDAARLAADDPPNLASAIRLWLFSRQSGAGDGREQAG
jgi:predicted DNA-binding ribbon-helix-helix protein